MPKVTGIGGIFFKAKDPKQLMEWYEQHLGLKFEHGFVQFVWAGEPIGTPPGSTTFSIGKEDSDHFKPSEKPFMVNFRVVNLSGLLKELKEKRVQVSEEMQEYDFGKFGWVMDPEGNKVELWEPK
jgi:predicted enzyme related to lactoylglutathione lyase